MSWSKNIPKIEGYYWVKAKGQLTGKDYVHPVHLYKSNGQFKEPNTVFSDGENFSVNNDMFIEWYSEQIAMPALLYKSERT